VLARANLSPLSLVLNSKVSGLGLPGKRILDSFFSTSAIVVTIVASGFKQLIACDTSSYLCYILDTSNLEDHSRILFSSMKSWSGNSTSKYTYRRLQITRSHLVVGRPAYRLHIFAYKCFRGSSKDLPKAIRTPPRAFRLQTSCTRAFLLVNVSPGLPEDLLLGNITLSTLNQKQGKMTRRF